MHLQQLEFLDQQLAKLTFFQLEPDNAHLPDEPQLLYHQASSLDALLPSVISQIRLLMDIPYDKMHLPHLYTQPQYPKVPFAFVDPS